MTIKAIVSESEFGGLDESVQGLYQQNSESKDYYLDLATGEADKLAFGLKEERDKLAANNAKLLDEKVKAIEKLSAAEQAAQKKTEGIDPKEHETQLQALKKSFEEEVQKAQTEKVELYNSLAQTAAQGEISRLVSEFNLDKDLGPLVLEKYIKGEVVDGKVFVRVHENGEKALVAGEPKTPKQLIEGFLKAEQYQKIFTANNGGGTGANNNQHAANTGGKTMKRSDFDKLQLSDPLSAAAFIKEGGKLSD